MAKLKKSSFLEGAFIATACIFASKILGIVYVIPFKKIIGDDGGALYGYAYNIYNIFLMVSSVGIPFAIAKLTSEYATLGQQEKKVRMYRLATRIVMAFSVLSFAICFGFACPIAQLIIGDIEGGNTLKDVVFSIRCISFTLLVVPLLSIKRGYLQGHKYIRQPSLSQVVEQFVRIVVILGGSCFFVYVVGNVTYAVGISVLAAGIGALIAYLYLTFVVRGNREELGLTAASHGTWAEDRTIVREVVLCAIPFIVITLANTLYTTTDMILVLRTLPRLGFTGPKTEFVSSVFTTWGTKFNAILSAVSTGLIVSMIPHMVSDYTKGDLAAVNENLNKGLKIILLVILPLALFICLTADSFWTVFYGKNPTGSSIIRYAILVTVFDCLYMVLNSLMQSLNKKKIIYRSVIFGLLANLILDVPLMILFSKLHLPAYYGATTATLIGFLISDAMSLRFLKKDMGIQYRETVRVLPRVILSVAMLIVLGTVLNRILPVKDASRLRQILNLVISGAVMGGAYLAVNLKELKTVLPEGLLKKLHLA